MPKRIQLSRAKGWRKPEGAIVVARPSRWGNGFRVGDDTRAGLLDMSDDATRVPIPDRATAVEFYRRWISYRLDVQDQVRRWLRGRDLVCWCPLDQPCHADVLLELANGPTP